MTDYTGIKIFDEHIEREHGKIGTDTRNEYDQGSVGQYNFEGKTK